MYVLIIPVIKHFKHENICGAYDTTQQHVNNKGHSVKCKYIKSAMRLFFTEKKIKVKKIFKCFQGFI